MKNNLSYQAFLKCKSFIDVKNCYFRKIDETLRSLNVIALAEVACLLMVAMKYNHNIFVMGNGGSSATAQHFVNDLCKMTKTKQLKFKAINLSDNVSWFTALANDEGYDKVFSGQLDNFVKKDDLVIGLSTSGNSKNIIEAFKMANNRGAKTISVVGFEDGGQLLKISKYSVNTHLPKGEYGIAEDIHSIICHLVTIYLSFKLQEMEG